MRLDNMIVFLKDEPYMLISDDDLTTFLRDVYDFSKEESKSTQKEVEQASVVAKNVVHIAPPLATTTNTGQAAPPPAATIVPAAIVPAPPGGGARYRYSRKRIRKSKSAAHTSNRKHKYKYKTSKYRRHY